MVVKARAQVKKDWDDEEFEAQNSFLKWGKIGDFVFGTLISKKQVESTLPDKKGQMQWIYEIKVKQGLYHDLDKKKNPIEPGIELEEGDIISVGGRSMYDSRMARVKRGQLVGLKYTEDLEAKTQGYNDTKLIKTFTPKNDAGEYEMDEEFLADDQEEGADENKFNDFSK